MTSDMHESFTLIYETNRWNSNESRSGPTSSLHWTANLRKELPRILHKFDVKLLFDAPCGDMNWMRELLRTITVEYIGGDIVAPLIDQLKADPELSERARFLCLDVTRHPLPAADMMLARDFLFHLSFDDTLAFMRNFASSDIRFLLTTSHINEGKFENRDIRSSNWRWIDLFQAPYNFPADTLDRIFDGKNDRYLYLWTRAQVADACERFGQPAALNARAALSPRSDDSRSGTKLPSSDNQQSGRAPTMSNVDDLLVPPPGEGQAVGPRALALASQQRHAEALALLDHALQANGGDAKLLNIARNVAFQHAGIHEAAKYALRLAEISPGELKNELFVVDWHLQSGAAAKALLHAEVLVERFPDSSQACVRKAQAFLAQSRGEEALKVLRQGAERFASDSKFLTFARNVAFEQRHIRQANAHAMQLATLLPDDRTNRVSLIRCSIALGEFSAGLAHAEALEGDARNDPETAMLKAQCLLGVHRVAEALQLLKEAVDRNPAHIILARWSRTIAFQNGRFDQALFYAREISRMPERTEHDQALLVQSLVAAREIEQLEEFFASEKVPQKGVLRKEEQHWEEMKRVRQQFPALASAWDSALRNPITRETAASTGKRQLGATMIQYWSQGAPPEDVQIVLDNWTSLMETEELGKVDLFARASAEAWIEKNAPEFLPHFSNAFHYAMESDIFRIAYASKQPCIYMDADSWPLENTAQILRFAIERKRTMLYLRAHRATILNGFFVSTPDSAFIKELAKQSLAVDPSALPKDHTALESSFGPTRYGRVFADLLASTRRISAIEVEVPGCSGLALDGEPIYFAHEAAVASVRPPFALGYKASEDYWKYLSAS